MKQETITLDEFEVRFQPLKNHLHPYAEFNGHLFNSYGPDGDVVDIMLGKYPARVWTVVESDGDVTITSGYHFVNRIGYILTLVPCPDDTMIEVEVD